MNKVALITGASSGIGKALAEKFASQNYDLVLVARDRTALETLSQVLSVRYKVKAHVLPQDLILASSSKAIFDALKAGGLAANEIKIDVLVNNAGFGIHGAFAQTPLEKETDLVELQIQSFLRLTKLFIPQMMARKSGLILNVASVYSYSPVPFQSVYSACKAFMLSFSESLREELREYNIGVTVLCPGSTQTEFRTRAGILNKKVSGMSAEIVADQGFKGLMSGKGIVIPGGVNRAFVSLVKHLPGVVASRLMIRINRARGVSDHGVK